MFLLSITLKKFDRIVREVEMELIWIVVLKGARITIFCFCTPCSDTRSCGDNNQKGVRRMQVLLTAKIQRCMNYMLYVPGFLERRLIIAIA